MIITHTPCVTQPFDIYEKQSGIEQQGGKQTNQKKNQKKCRLILIHGCSLNRVYYARVRHPAVALKLFC